MYGSIEKTGDVFLLKCLPGVKGNGPTKKFTHGRVVFDSDARTIRFSDTTPLSLPSFDSVVAEGSILPVGLVGPDGALRPQRRDILVRKNAQGLLYSPGISKTPSTRTKEDGWRIRVYKFRAFFTHPGVETEAASGSNTVELPAWLKASIERQRRYRNRLVWLCAQARDACRPVDHDAFLRFLHETVLPELDAFNLSCGRANTEAKIKAGKLRQENPSIFHLTRFAGYLQYLEKEGKPVPAGLAKKIFDFAKDTKLDFSPINEFHRNLGKIFSQERYLDSTFTVNEVGEDGITRPRTVYTHLTDPAEIDARAAELRLRDWEWKPVAAGFAATLKNRKTRGSSFFEGWPRFSKPDDADWGIHYYLNGGGVAADAVWLKGMRGLHIGPAVSPESSGRQFQAGSLRNRRSLCPAEISFHDRLSDSQFSFRFAVLHHHFPWPEGSAIKEWKLIAKGKELWLCLVVQGKFAKPVLKSGDIGAVHIGWRKEGSEIQPALVYDSATGACRRVVVDAHRGPEPTDAHTPFRINMGASKWGRRSLYWVLAKEGSPVLRVEPHSPDSVQIQDTWAGLALLARWRDSRKDAFKSLLADNLSPVPQGFAKAGVRTLHQIGAETGDPELTRAYREWATEDELIQRLVTSISVRVAARLKDGYIRVAHDIVAFFLSRGVTTIAIQNSLLAKVSKKKRNSKQSAADKAILARSQAQRQHVAPALLLEKFAHVADTCGLSIVRVDNALITQRHNDAQAVCNYLNPPAPDRIIVCESCGKQYDQDQNACINMVELAQISTTERLEEESIAWN